MIKFYIKTNGKSILEIPDLGERWQNVGETGRWRG